LTENTTPGSDSLIATGLYRKMNTDPRSGGALSKDYFEDSGRFFVGRPEFDSSFYTSSHGVGFGEAYRPAASGDACVFGANGPLGYVGELPCR
jgi:hypothetical protein